LSTLQVRLLPLQRALLDVLFCFDGCAYSCAGVANDSTAQGEGYYYYYYYYYYHYF